MLDGRDTSTVLLFLEHVNVWPPPPATTATAAACPTPCERLFRYAWEALAKVVFEGQTYSGIDGCTICYGETGEQVSAKTTPMRHPLPW